MAARLALGSLLALFTACSPATDESSNLPPPEEHARKVQAWRIERHDRLVQPDGWLSLVGLHFLHEGENTFGSGPDADVQFPQGRAPDRAGSFVLKDGVVTVRADPDAAVTSNGRPVTELQLQSDAAGDPTELRLGSLLFYVIDRMGKSAIRVKDAQSPLRSGFGQLEYYPIDYGWLVEAKFEPYDQDKRLEYVNSAGLETVDEAAGALAFEKDGATYRIDVRREGDELFVVFGDETNGSETYEGGRFIYVPLPDKNGMVPLDFNRAYNPPCVFTPYATCPRPTPENRLPIAVQAGEKLYRHEAEAAQ